MSLIGSWFEDAKNNIAYTKKYGQLPNTNTDTNTEVVGAGSMANLLASLTNPSGWGGGGYSDALTEKQKKAAKNLEAITKYNAETIKNDYKNSMEAFKISNDQSENTHKVQTKQMKQKVANEWYHQQQKQQSALSPILTAAGNMLNGSGSWTIKDAVARVDDMADATTLEQLKQNLEAVNNSYAEALGQNQNASNEKSVQTESALRELFADYVAQRNNIHADLVEDFIEDGKLKVPDWIDEEWYSKNIHQAIKPDLVDLFRPDGDPEKLWNTDVLKPNTGNTSSSTNRSYQQRMALGYERRTQ